MPPRDAACPLLHWRGGGNAGAWPRADRQPQLLAAVLGGLLSLQLLVIADNKPRCRSQQAVAGRHAVHAAGCSAPKRRRTSCCRQQPTAICLLPWQRLQCRLARPSCPALAACRPGTQQQCSTANGRCKHCLLLFIFRHANGNDLLPLQCRPRIAAGMRGKFCWLPRSYGNSNKCLYCIACCDRQQEGRASTVCLPPCGTGLNSKLNAMNAILHSIYN